MILFYIAVAASRTSAWFSDPDRPAILFYIAVAAGVVLTIALIEAGVYWLSTRLPFGRAVATALVATVVGGAAAVAVAQFVVLAFPRYNNGPLWLAAAAPVGVLVQLLVTVGLNWSFERRRRLVWVAAIVISLVTLLILLGLGLLLIFVASAL